MYTQLHIPISKTIKVKAEKVAKKHGYSSLQEVIRVFLVQLGTEEIKPILIRAESIEYLTPAQDAVLTKKLEEALKEHREGKAHVFDNVDDMTQFLNRDV